LASIKSLQTESYIGNNISPPTKLFTDYTTVNNATYRRVPHIPMYA